MKLIKYWIWLVVVLSCGHLAAAEPTETAPISVQPKPGGYWQVEYRLDYPVDGIRFMRSAGFLREENWQVTTPGYHFARDDADQLLVRNEGAEPANLIRITFPVDDRFINRDYELFNVFTDGGLALFTGHFYVRPYVNQVPEVKSRPFLTDIKVTPPKDQTIAFRSRVSSESLRWEDATGEGTYVYIGDAMPVVEDDIIAIFDRGLPEWLAVQAKTRIPELMAYYQERMGKHSPHVPMVLFSYDAESPNEYAHNGGTRPDLIQIRARGESWEQEALGPMRLLIHFFAHEAAHLWNGQAARSAPGAPIWIHEGSADAMAQRAMWRLGIFDRDEYHRQQEEALNACHSGLRGEALVDAKQSRLHYDCGNVLALWSELALKAVNPEQDLFDIWQRLIQSEVGSSYGQSDYFYILEEMGVEEKHINAMRHFVGHAHNDPAAVLASGMAAVGVEVERNDKAASAGAGTRAAGSVVTTLLETDCQGSHGFYVQGDHLRLAHLDSCQRAEEGMRIDQVEKTSIAAPGFEAYHNALAACEQRGAVAIGNSQSTINLRCPSALPPLKGWWTLSPDVSL